MPHVATTKATISSGCSNAAKSWLKDDTGSWEWCGGTNALKWTFSHKTVIAKLRVKSLDSRMVDSFRIEYQQDLDSGSTWQTLMGPNGNEYVSHN